MIGSPPPSFRDDPAGSLSASGNRWLDLLLAAIPSYNNAKPFHGILSFVSSAADMKTKPSRMPPIRTLQKNNNHTSKLMSYRILFNVMILLAYLGCTASVVLGVDDDGDGIQVCNLCHLIRVCMSTNHYRPTISIPFI